MEVSRSKLTNQVVLLLVLCLLLSSGCMTNRRKWKYLYPDGYIGWTRMNFKKDAAMPPIEDGAYIIKFTPTGELDISTDVLKEGGYYPLVEFYYCSSDMQYKRIWPTSAGSVNIQKKEDLKRQNYEESQSYQFVGTDEEYQVYGARFKDEHGEPRIGLVKREQLQDQ